mgnify:CR=1 FL=1
MTAEFYAMAAARWRQRCQRCVALTLLTVGARAPRSATRKLRSPLMNNATQGLRRLAAYNIDEVDKLTADAAADSRATTSSTVGSARLGRYHSAR